MAYISRTGQHSFVIQAEEIRICIDPESLFEDVDIVIVTRSGLSEVVSKIYEATYKDIKILSYGNIGDELAQ